MLGRAHHAITVFYFMRLVRGLMKARAESIQWLRRPAGSPRSSPTSSDTLGIGSFATTDRFPPVEDDPRRAHSGHVEHPGTLPTIVGAIIFTETSRLTG
jgi:hypothetical protein